MQINRKSDVHWRKATSFSEASTPNEQSTIVFTRSAVITHTVLSCQSLYGEWLRFCPEALLHSQLHVQQRSTQTGAFLPLVDMVSPYLNVAVVVMQPSEIILCFRVTSFSFTVLVLRGRSIACCMTNTWVKNVGFFLLYTSGKLDSWRHTLFLQLKLILLNIVTLTTDEIPVRWEEKSQTCGYLPTFPWALRSILVWRCRVVLEAGNTPY